MATIPQVASAVQTILGPVAERAARATGLVQRASKLTGARFVQTLVFGWLAQPEARLSQLAQMAATLGVAITAQGLDDRFGVASAECLREVLEAAVRVVLAADAVAVPVLRRFTAVAVQDGTTIGLPAALAAVWPGCGGGTPTSGAAALKLSVRLDLVSGRLQGPYVEAGRTNDRATTVADLPLPPGGLRLADLGFFSLADLAAQDAHGASWLSRWQAGTAVATAGGEPQQLLALLAAGEAAAVDRPVLLGAQQRLPVRLLATRVPQAVADERRRRLRATARAKGHAVSATRLRLCGWTVLLTNAPAERLSLREALVLARARCSSRCSSNSGKATRGWTRGARPIPGASSPRSTPSSWPRWCSTGSCWSAAGTTPTAAWSPPPRPSGPTRPAWPRRSPPTHGCATRSRPWPAASPPSAA